MKKIFLMIALFLSICSHAQLQFWNTNSTSNMPLFEVKWGEKTTIYSKVGYETKPTYVFNKVAPQVYNGDGKTKFKMTVESVDNVAKRIFEISYTHYRQTNYYLGYIKATYIYHDKRPTKVLEEHYETVKNP